MDEGSNQYTNFAYTVNGNNIVASPFRLPGAGDDAIPGSNITVTLKDNKVLKNIREREYTASESLGFSGAGLDPAVLEDLLVSGAAGQIVNSTFTLA